MLQLMLTCTQQECRSCGCSTAWHICHCKHQAVHDGLISLCWFFRHHSTKHLRQDVHDIRQFTGMQFSKGSSHCNDDGRISRCSASVPPAPDVSSALARGISFRTRRISLAFDRSSAGTVSSSLQNPGNSCQHVGTAVSRARERKRHAHWSSHCDDQERAQWLRYESRYRHNT